MDSRLLNILSNMLIVLGAVAAFVALAGVVLLLVNFGDRSADSTSWLTLFLLWLVGGAFVWALCLYAAIRLRKAAKRAAA